MDETIYTVMLSLSKFVGTGFPLVIFILSSTVLVFAHAAAESTQKAILRLRVTGIFCALVWLFYYAEIWSPSRIPLFDYGAPLIALLALIVLPVLAFLIWSQRDALVSGAWLTSLFILAYTLILSSLAPGIFLVLFFSAAMSSG